MEIEKKYLLSELPEGLDRYPSVSIEQGYVIVTGDEELRVRKKDRSCFLTYKKGSGTTRDEIELGISEDQYLQFREHVIGTVIHKKRIEYPFENFTVEIDVYKDSLWGLIVAEVEFPTIKSMQKFSPPPWLENEVSENSEFKNKNLALGGLPESLREKWKKKRPAWHYRQSGVVPFRQSEAGPEILLITTRKSGKWIVPKGIVEPDLSPAASAIKEALEEAGVEGEVIDGIDSSYTDEKWNGECRVVLYPLKVEKQHKHWDEEEDRRRKWVALEEVDEYIHNPELTEALRYITDKLFN